MAGAARWRRTTQTASLARLSASATCWSSHDRVSADRHWHSVAASSGQSAWRGSRSHHGPDHGAVGPVKRPDHGTSTTIGWAIQRRARSNPAAYARAQRDQPTGGDAGRASRENQEAGGELRLTRPDAQNPQRVRWATG